MAHSLNKGKRGEREVVHLLQPIADQVFAMFEREAPRLERNLAQSREGGSDLNGIPFLDVEIKRREEERVEEWWKQACAQAKPHTQPVLMWRTNRGGWQVMLMLTCASTNMTIRSVISLRDFGLWFRCRLVAYLSEAIIAEAGAP